MAVPLHTHSWYSSLEGVSSPEQLIKHALAGGHTALALTDTNNLFGAVPFFNLAVRHGLRPLLGACLKQQRSRCVALVADRAGYRSLCRVLSRLHQAVPGSEGKPLVQLLCDNAAGLHVLMDDAALAERLREAFGRRLWLEIIRPRGPAGSRHERELLECGRRLGILAVASTAAHFTSATEYPTYRVVTAVRQRLLLDQLPAQLPVTPAHHLPTVAQLEERFRDAPELLQNSDDLAELLRSDVLPRDVILPEPCYSRTLDLTRYLHRLCERGLRQRELGTHLGARQRLREELVVIEAANLTGYFLTVRDIARHARRQGHTLALRGSAGNSLVCYLLGITDVDPLHFGLPMERFLHPGRHDLPDIDLDFDWRVRDEVIDHVIRRYGAAHAARISAHLFLQPRSAFREAGKVHGLSTEQISRLMTTLAEKVDDLLLPPADAAEGTSTVRAPAAFPLEAPRWPRLVADARRLLGRPQHLSLHPGGIVITPAPLEDHVPLQMAAKGVAVTQFEKDAIEQVGLVKIDLLGNRALATVDEARRRAGLDDSVRKEGQPRRLSVALRSNPILELDRDPPTTALLQRGESLGVTQLESPAMRHLLIQLQPTCLMDVIQALALLRPGAASIGMKDRFIRRRIGLEPPRLLHPQLARVLGDTHGLMLYEDDALRLMQEVAGLDPADADRFRKRVAKHQTEEEARQLEAEFLRLCARRGLAPEAVAELWLQLSKFNRYSFCKSHAVSYGLIAWQAAYLKAHHPLAFWTAALNNNQSAYPRRVYIEAIKRAGIRLLLPCVNHSEDAFTPADGGIRIGLGAIAGLPAQTRADLLLDRGRHGPYRDLAELLHRVALPPEALALLIRPGALDSFGLPRPALFLHAQLQAAARGEPGALFPNRPAEEWMPPDYSAEHCLREQWRLFGFVLGPPLFSLFRCPQPQPDNLIGSQEVHRHAGRRVCVQGLVATARHVFTQDGRPLQFITMEDDDGLVEVTLFPGTCRQVPYLTLGPYRATGVVEEQHGVFTVSAQSFEEMEGAAFCGA
jgi:DNA-directed DNA polymerase III PolC